MEEWFIPLIAVAFGVAVLVGAATLLVLWMASTGFENDTTDLDDFRPCEAMIHPGSYYDQPSYCDEEAIPGADYCHAHRHAGDER